MAQRGAVAAGHPVTAEAGARGAARGRQRGRRRGRRGAGLVRHREPADRPRRRRLHARPQPATRPPCSTSSSPCRAPTGSSAAPSWSRSRSTSPTESAQVFHVGAASCGVPGTPAGLERALRAVRDGAARGAGGPGRAARPRRRRGQRRAGLLHRDPRADPDPLRRGGSDLRARGAICSARATCSASPTLGDALERLGAEGSEPLLPRRGRAADLRVGGRARRHARAPPISPPTRRSRASRSRATFRDREVLTNPPPSSGGILIAFALELLEPPGRRARHESMVGRWRRRRRSARTSSSPGSYDEGFAASLPGGRSARLDHPHHRGRRRRHRAPASPARTAPARA